MFDLFTILPLAAALFVFWKLRQVLGTRGGAEPPADRRPPHVNGRDVNGRDVNGRDASGRDARPVSRDRRDDDNVVTLPPREATAAGGTGEPEIDRAAIERHAKGDAAVRDGLLAVAEADRDFHPDDFLQGARMAYEMIVTAFADGDKATLRNLLSPDVYESFASVIDERARRGEHVEASFVGIEEATIVDAGVEDDEAQVSVAFVSQMISATKNGEGEVIEGDEQEVAEITDRWTFARPVRSSDPNWNLVATDA